MLGARNDDRQNFDFVSYRLDDSVNQAIPHISSQVLDVQNMPSEPLREEVNHTIVRHRERKMARKM